MLLTSRDGAGVDLRPACYQYADLSGGPGGWDANWLVVHGRVRTAAGESWSFADPCLTTWEAEELRDWLQAAAGSLVPVDGVLTFTEPNLGFSVADQDDEVLVVRVHLSHESLAGRPRGDEGARVDASAYSIPIRIGREDLLAAVRAWEHDLTPFPQR